MTRRLPWLGMRHLAPAAVLVVGLLLAAGCGGGGGSSGGDWAVLDQGKFSSNEPAYLNTTVGRPINGGGPELQFRNFNGNIYIRKAGVKAQ